MEAPTLMHPRKWQTEPVPAVLAVAVRATLERILRSPDFRASKRNRKFLRTIVEAELEGRGHEINGYVIGSEVFARGKTFDHVKDPIVRIEATKLRRDLEHFYLTAGRGEEIAITIPKGGYRPHFQRREVSLPSVRPPFPLREAGVSIASVRLSGPLAALQPPMRARLADVLTQQSNLEVYVSAEPAEPLLDSESVRRVAAENGTAFVLSGDVWQDDGTSCFVARLHEGGTGRQLWSQAFRGDADELARRVAAEVGAVQHRWAVSRHPAEEGTR